MAKRSTLASLERDIELVQKASQRLLMDLDLMRVGIIGLSGVAEELAQELKALLKPEPVLTPPSLDTTDGN